MALKVAMAYTCPGVHVKSEGLTKIKKKTKITKVTDEG